MKELKIYRLLTFILLPFGVLFGLQDLSLIFVALGNPALLFSAFILTCIIIYIFASFTFFYKAVIKSTSCKRSLKDFIKVNAVVSIIFCLLCIVSCIFFIIMFNNPVLFKEVGKQISAQPKNSFPFNLNDPEFLSAVKKSIAIMLPFSIVLLVHIILTFRLLKKMKQSFL